MEFIRPLKDVVVKRVGSDVTLECEVSKESARAQWLKDGHEMYSDRKYDISASGYTHRLTIRDVESKDVADYAIVIKGHRSVGRLTVEAPPVITSAETYDKGLVLKVRVHILMDRPM